MGELDRTDEILWGHKSSVLRHKEVGYHAKFLFIALQTLREGSVI